MAYHVFNKMKTLTACLLVVALSLSCGAQDRSGLSDAQVKSIVAALENKKLAEKDLVPQGFTKVAEARGDLNHDGVDDLALIVRQKPEQGSDDSFLPQAVLLFLGEKSGTFTFWKIGPHHFLDSSSSLMSDGGVGNFKIEKGVLIIQSDVAVSMGSWSAGGCTQKWRLEQSGFRLIGLTIVDMMRNCGCGDTRDTNLLTGDQIYTSDRGPGLQKTKLKTKRTKGASQQILWDDFDYDKFCTM